MDKSEKNLKSALARLEELVKEMNQNDLDVEEGLKKFKEGVELIKFARRELGEAENQFQELKNELESSTPSEED